MTKRQESNEEILLRRLEKFGHLDLQVRFLMKDEKGTWRHLTGHAIYLKKIRNQGLLFRFIEAIEGKLKEIKNDLHKQEGKDN